jgi:acyl-coenzyme A synthetase/AMP-(fatty) acid ligase
MLLEQAMKSLLQDSDTVLLITNSDFLASINAIRTELPAIAEDRYLLIDSSDTPGYQDYHALKSAAADSEPAGIAIDPEDPFNIMYSSGSSQRHRAHSSDPSSLCNLLCSKFSCQT